MTGENHPKPESATEVASESDAGINLVINQYQPVVFIDGAVLNPANGMVELLLMKQDIKSTTDKRSSPNNIVQGRYIMQMETFARIAKLFKDQYGKLNDKPNSSS